MASNRLTRVNELLQREIAASLFRVMNIEGFEVARVTVTHVFTSPDLRHTRVLVSFRGDEFEAKRHLNLLQKHRPDLQQEVFSKVTLKYSPRFRFELDHSLSEGDRVLQILQNLDSEAGGEQADSEVSDEAFDGTDAEGHDEEPGDG